MCLEKRTGAARTSTLSTPNIPAQGLRLRAVNSCLPICPLLLVRRYSFSLYPVRFFSHRAFSTEEVFNEICHFVYICHCPAFCHCSAFCHFLYTATPHSALCHFLHVGHVGQFLFQPYALASRLRGCVRVTRTSIRDDPVDPGDIHSRDIDRGTLSSCIYTWLRARHLLDKTIERR